MEKPFATLFEDAQLIAVHPPIRIPEVPRVSVRHITDFCWNLAAMGVHPVNWVALQVGHLSKYTGRDTGDSVPAVTEIETGGRELRHETHSNSGSANV